MRLGCGRSRARATQLGSCSRRARASTGAINPSTARQRRRRAHGPVCGLDLLGVRPHLHPSADAMLQALWPARIALSPTHPSECAERGERFRASAAVGGSHRQHGGRGAGCGGGGGGCRSDVGRPSARFLRIATHPGERRSSTPTPPLPHTSTWYLASASPSVCHEPNVAASSHRELCGMHPAASPRNRTATGPRPNQYNQKGARTERRCESRPSTGAVCLQRHPSPRTRCWDTTRAACVHLNRW
jgi:hypothetical protein